MESQPQNAEFRNNPNTFTHVLLLAWKAELTLICVGTALLRSSEATELLSVVMVGCDIMLLLTTGVMLLLVTIILGAAADVTRLLEMVAVVPDLYELVPLLDILE